MIGNMELTDLLLIFGVLFGLSVFAFVGMVTYECREHRKYRERLDSATKSRR